jgi:hypothetical protein
VAASIRTAAIEEMGDRECFRVRATMLAKYLNELLAISVGFIG